MVALIALLMATSEPAAANHVPASRITRSYYVGSSSSDKAVLLGCRQGDKNGRMTLFFEPLPRGARPTGPRCGAPNLDDRPDPEPGHGLHPWIRLLPAVGVVPLLIGLGTSNSTIDGRSTTGSGLTAGPGGMVDQVATWASRFYPMAQVYGAGRRAVVVDLHQGPLDAWLRRPVPGAPRPVRQLPRMAAPPRPPPMARNNGWNQSAVWCTSHGITSLVDDPDLRNEWRECQAMAAHRRMGYPQLRDGIHFYGVLSQSGACAQVGGCSGTNNSPHRAGIHDLRLRSHAHTWQSSIDTITDVNWHS